MTDSAIHIPEQRGAHAACPGAWCLTFACSICGEMLTNIKPKGDGFVGMCMSHGRSAAAVLMRREDCLLGTHAVARSPE